MPLPVYVDQNVLTAFATGGADWRTTEVGSLLNGPETEVWISPVHLCEIAQASNASTRTALARTALELASFRRVLPSYQHLLVEAFMGVLERARPEVIRGKEYFAHHLLSDQRSLIAALSLLAHGVEPTDAALTDILKSKFGSQLIHAEAVADPKKWVDKLLECTDKLLLDDSASSADLLDSTTIDELRDAAAAVEPGEGVGKKLRDTLQKNRRRIARAYGAVDVGQSLLHVLRLPMDLDWTFDVHQLEDHWNDVLKRLGPKSRPFPKEGGIATALRECYLTMAHGKGLLPGTISNEIVIREVERFSARDQAPNAGAAFDGDHAAYLLWTRVFICDDEDLRNAARPLLSLVEEETGGRWKPEIFSLDQAPSGLRRLLAAGT